VGTPPNGERSPVWVEDGQLTPACRECGYWEAATVRGELASQQETGLSAVADSHKGKLPRRAAWL